MGFSKIRIKDLLFFSETVPFCPWAVSGIAAYPNSRKYDLTAIPDTFIGYIWIYREKEGTGYIKTADLLQKLG